MANPNVIALPVCIRLVALLAFSAQGLGPIIAVLFHAQPRRQHQRERIGDGHR